MLQYDIDDLFQAFDEAKDDGILQFVVPGHYLNPEDTKGKHNIARELITGFFYRQQVATVRLKLVKSFIEDVLVELGQTDEGHWVVKMNFAKLMLLPCEKPAEELQELRKLFEACKTFMEKDPTRMGLAQICNERDDHNKVYGSIKLAYRKNEDGSGDESIAQSQATLDALVASSRAIQDYLRQVALALGTMGPYSWTMLDEDHLFGYAKGPWATQFMAKKMAKDSAKSGAKP
jgi:hypothetical protein